MSYDYKYHRIGNKYYDIYLITPLFNVNFPYVYKSMGWLIFAVGDLKKIQTHQ